MFRRLGCLRAAFEPPSDRGNRLPDPGVELTFPRTSNAYGVSQDRDAV